MRNKIIVLDIDGVVNLSHPDNLFDLKCIHNLKTILEATKAKILLSTSWRLYKSTKENMFQQFKQAGMDIEQLVCGETPDNMRFDFELNEWNDVTRGGEIQSWIDANPTMIEKFAILDDDESAESAADNRGIFIHTQMRTGVTAEIAAKTILFLNNPF